MIYFLRHGQSEANILKKFVGITDSNLSDFGKKQSEKAGELLKDYIVSHIYSSSLKRAIDTAQIVANTKGFNEKVIINPNINEINFGLFENLTWEEICEKYKDYSNQWIEQNNKFVFPCGESYTDVVKRVSEFVKTLENNSLVVTHFGVIQAILICLCIANEDNIWDFEISNGDIVIIDVEKNCNNEKVYKIKDILKNNF